MYSAYLKEKTNIEMHETDKGFVGYTVHPHTKTLEVADIYVKKEFRDGAAYIGLIKELEKVAIAKKLSKIICCVDLTHKEPERSMYGILRLKFKYSHMQGECMYFYKLTKDHTNIAKHIGE